MTQSHPDKQRHESDLAILNTVAQELNRSVELHEAVQAVLAQAAALLDLHTGWVWLVGEDERPYLAATQNLPPALEHNPQKMEGDCFCLRTYREGDLAGAANVNVVECSRLHGLVDGTDGLRYHASIPLYAHGKKLGVLNVASRDWRQLAPEDLQLLYTIGDLLGIAIERARLFDRSARLGAVEERNRLAREIHDTLVQGLTAVSLQLESADVLLEAGAEPEAVRQKVEQALRLTRANLEEARRSVMDLRAAPLQGRSLEEALILLAEQAAAAVDLMVTGSRPLSPRVESGLYRIAQEALTNIGRHAQATQVRMALTMTPDQVTLTVEDNGRGFDPAAVLENKFGLIGMNERVRLLDGRFRLESSEGEGTRLEVVIPV